MLGGGAWGRQREGVVRAGVQLSALSGGAQMPRRDLGRAASPGERAQIPLALRRETQALLRTPWSVPLLPTGFSPRESRHFPVTSFRMFSA